MHYTANQETKITIPDECLLVTTDILTFSKPQTHHTHHLMPEDGVMTKFSSNLSNSTEDDFGLARSKDSNSATGKGFKPGANFRWNAGEDTFDIQIDNLFMAKVIPFDKMCSMSQKEATEEYQEKLKDLFTRCTWSEEARKNLWRSRIGNKLKITRQMFKSLVERLAVESISRKAEKVIIDDLDRTFPQCSDVEEGKAMYADMKLVLSLIEVAYQTNVALQTRRRLCPRNELPSSSDILLLRCLRELRVSS